MTLNHKYFPNIWPLAIDGAELLDLKMFCWIRHDQTKSSLLYSIFIILYFWFNSNSIQSIFLIPLTSLSSVHPPCERDRIGVGARVDRRVSLVQSRSRKCPQARANLNGCPYQRSNVQFLLEEVQWLQQKKVQISRVCGTDLGDILCERCASNKTGRNEHQGGGFDSWKDECKGVNTDWEKLLNVFEI